MAGRAGFCKNSLALTRAATALRQALAVGPHVDIPAGDLGGRCHVTDAKRVSIGCALERPPRKGDRGAAKDRSRATRHWTRFRLARPAMFEWRCNGSRNEG